MQCRKIGDLVVVGKVEVVQAAWSGEGEFGSGLTYGSALLCCCHYLHFATCENAWIDWNDWNWSDGIEAYDYALNYLPMAISLNDYAGPDLNQNSPMRGKDRTWLQALMLEGMFGWVGTLLKKLGKGWFGFA